MDDFQKLRKARILLIAAIAVIAVLGTMLVYDTQKLVAAQNAYSKGWNECAVICNGKLDILNDKCFVSVGIVNDSVWKMSGNWS